MEKLTVYGRIVKVDLAKQEVTGVAMDETPDRDGEIYDYESSKPYVQAWSNGFADTTKAAGQEVSYGNIRSMHSNIAAGKIVEPIQFDDAAKSVTITAKISDPDEWQKCVEGVYTGFSVKGRAIRKWRDGRHTRYTVDPIEKSLVDLPCNPGAKFLAVKADGSTEEREFQHVEESDEEIEKRTFSERRRKDLAASGKALPDGSFPIVNREDLENAIRAIGRAKDPDAAKAHIKARAKALGAEDALPDDWKDSEKVTTVADLEKLLQKGAELITRMTAAQVEKEKHMTDAENQAAEIAKAAAIDKMKAARKAHDKVGACLGGYCDHKDGKECAGQVKDHHTTVEAAFGGKDRVDNGDGPEKAAKAAEAETVEKSADPQIAALEAQLAELKALVEKSATVERAKPVINATVHSKEGDVKKSAGDAEDELKKIEDNDPERVEKRMKVIHSLDPVLVKL